MHCIHCVRVALVNSIMIFLAMYSHTIYAEPVDTAENAPPVLLTDPLIQVSPELLKRGIWGTSSAVIDIDSTGAVQSCSTTLSGNEAFDSLVKYNITAATFTPAIENGQPVSSTVSFEFALPYDSLVTQCFRLQPTLTGTVIDSVTRVPLPQTRLLLHYNDTTEDNTLSIGFARYLSIIGSASVQSYNGVVVSTVTDSLGNFSFRCLPRGPFTVSVQSKGYEMRKFKGRIYDNKTQRCHYSLQALSAPSQDTTYVIRVYGQKTFAENSVHIAEEEKHTGFSPFLSNVLQKKAEIRFVPEGPSKMLVRSGGPYDNVYLIAGVPMLAPFHFGGHPYADIDGLMISTLSHVNVTISDIAAKLLDVSGCIVEADPERIRYGNKNDGSGWYFKGDFSMIGVDLLAAYSRKKNKDDFVQVGFSQNNFYRFSVLQQQNPSAHKGDYGIGVPFSYGNATFAGSKVIGPFRSTGFGWFAWDQYSEPNLAASLDHSVYEGVSFLPWGMGSIKVTTAASNRSMTIGGAHQFFGTGKRNYLSLSNTRLFLNNGIVTVDLDTVLFKPFVAKTTVRFNHDEWNGFLSHETGSKIDTLDREGSETGIHLNTSLIKQVGQITARLDLLASMIKYADSLQLTGDAGARVTYENKRYLAGLYFGRITSRPDIRGLPDSRFRMQLNRTYVASLPFFIRYGMITKCGVEPYIRYSTNAPQLNPYSLIWDPSKSSPVLAAGADLQCRIKPVPWAELYTALNIADASRRTYSGDSRPYEWYLPWTCRSGIHLNLKNDMVHFYVDYLHTKGLPYFDKDIAAYTPLPSYRSLDIKFEYHTPVQNRRFVNQLDCYFELKNAQDLDGTANVRDYYWDSNNLRQPIFLGDGRVDIGARFGLKL